jgi:predicted aspartyl protease
MFLSPLLLLLLATQAQDAPSEELHYDNRGRPAISVTVNGEGPFDMVIDSAAQSSLLSPTLAAKLGLPTMQSGMRIQGATGDVAASIYPVDRLTSALFDRHFVGLFRLPNPQSTSALGIVGMESFSANKLLFDREAHRVVGLPSGAALPGFAAHKGQLGLDGLLRVPIVINGVTIEALVDTGAAATVANAAAIRALGWEANDPRMTQDGEIRGATDHAQSIRVAKVDTLRIGPATLRQVPVYFTADDEATPAVILGSDLLNLFDAFAIDFPQAALEIRVPAKSSAGTAPASGAAQ